MTETTRLSRRILLRRAAVTGGTAAALPAGGDAFAAAAAAEPPPFAEWLRGLRRDALAQGVRERTLDRALGGVEPIPRVIELDRKQPEGRLTFAEYRSRVVTDGRVAKGRELLGRHAPLLRRVEDRYGVPGRVVVALWGMESNFGERQGTFSVFAALATLAHEGRRAAFFRKELLAALKIADAGDRAPESMTGSWAGAMGQCQFMPTTYLGYAQDFDGDGRRDIWRSQPDVFASAANYLSGSGWDPGLRWGRPVSAPAGVRRERSGLEHKAPLNRWQAAGVRLPDGGDLPAAAVEASLLDMDGPSYLVYPNFRTIMVWNRSTYFALCVGLLSDLIERG
jgi:membrane-bound lytic murein transglycosylase B